MLYTPSIAIRNVPRRLTALEVCQQYGITPARLYDAGAAASYTTGQVWNDLSGNGAHFNRGADASASTDDPTFVGTAGMLTGGEYWSLDGGDNFTKAAANGTLENGHHKDSAAWSIIQVFNLPSIGSNVSSYATTTDSGSPGVRLQQRNTGQVRLIVSNDSGQTVMTGTSNSRTDGAWNFFGMSFDEAGGASGSFLYLNGTTTAFDGAVSSPSANNAASVATIGSEVGEEYLPNGSLLAVHIIVDGLLTVAQMAGLRRSIMARFA